MENWWSEPLRDVFAGRRVIGVGAVASAWGRQAELLRAFGADDVLVIATEGAGFGPVDEVETIVVEPPEDVSFMGRIRFGIDTIESPPSDVLEAVERFDPDREAIVVGSFLNEASHLDGRPLLSYRRAEWVALEDKVVADGLWDRAGVGRQPSLVVAKSGAPAAAAEIDRGHGTVWAADARDGYHGGAQGTCWVVDAESQAAAFEVLDPICDRVRVMPFVDGIACAIHGMVLPDGTAAFRPIEMVTLRRGTDLVYAGCSTFWDPPTVVRDQMRDVARRVGEQLRAEVDFRGAFTVDGVVDAEGFWPTELNPRYGAGLATIAVANDGLPILLLNDLIVGGRPIGMTAPQLEDELTSRADESRGGGTWRVIDATTVVDDRDVSHIDGAWRWTDPGDEPDGAVTNSTGFVRCEFSAASTPVGKSITERAAAFWSFAARELGTPQERLTWPDDPFAAVS
jgi:hypothetical protein